MSNFILQSTIGSVLAQDYPNIEYIIADDGSYNFDEAMLSEFIKDNRKANIVAVKIIHNENNIGTVKNMNNAYKLATGKYVVNVSMEDYFLNDDTLSRIIERAESLNSNILSYGRYLCSSDSQILRSMPCRTWESKIAKLNTAEKQYVALITGRSYEMVSGSSVCLKRTFVEDLGCFDEQFKLWEDGPFFAKATRTGNVIHTAYDIRGLMYRVGGVSGDGAPKLKQNCTNNAMLDCDSKRFLIFESETIPPKIGLTNRRIIKYNRRRSLDKSKFDQLFSYLLFLDVVIHNTFFRYGIVKDIKCELDEYAAN